MQHGSSFFSRFRSDQRGGTAIEYGLIAALIAVGFLAGLRALGSGNTDSWNTTTNTLVNAMN